MKTTNVLCEITVFAVFFLASLGCANAALVYDAGPIYMPYGGGAIYDGWSWSDSFTISSPATLTLAQVGLFVSHNAAPTTLQWSIGTTAYGNDVSSGTATLANTLFGYMSWAYYESTFAISGTLADGTYYLTLSQGVASDNGIMCWANSGLNSPSFQLYGETTPVPEPTTCIAGVLLLLPFGAQSIRYLMNRKT